MPPHSGIFAAPAFADHNRTNDQGRKKGRWTEISDNGDLFESHYVNGKRLGPWGLCGLPTGLAVNAYNVKSKDHGDCVLRSGNDVLKGPLADGGRHGHWIERDTDDSVAVGPYVNGKKHGQ